jgi:hypothetical protein
MCKVSPISKSLVLDIYFQSQKVLPSAHAFSEDVQLERPV